MDTITYEGVRRTAHHVWAEYNLSGRDETLDKNWPFNSAFIVDVKGLPQGVIKQLLLKAALRMQFRKQFPVSKIVFDLKNGTIRIEADKTNTRRRPSTFIV